MRGPPNKPAAGQRRSSISVRLGRRWPGVPERGRWPKRRRMRHVSHFYLLAVILAVLTGCSEDKRLTRDQLRRDPLIWERGQQAYRTNPAAAAYRSLFALKKELTGMQAAGRNYLRYSYCQALVSGQLFVLAEHLGDTNSANVFFRESSNYWAQDARENRRPEKDYSQSVLRDLILNYDTHTGPVLWRQENGTNSAQ